MDSSSSFLTAYDPSLSQNASSNPPKIVPFHEIQTILTHMLSNKDGVDRILQSQLEALQMASSGSSSNDGHHLCANLPIQTAGQPPYPALAAGPGAQVCIKTGYASNDTVLVSKIAAGGGKIGGNTGSVSVYDQKTLRLQAVLCDEGLLTEIRTAAAAVVATRAALAAAAVTTGSAKEKVIVSKLGIVGGGVQAIWHLRLLAASQVIDPQTTTVIVKTTLPASAQKFIQTMKESSYGPDRLFKQMQVYDDTTTQGSRFRGCQVIHTVTPSRIPVLELDDVSLPHTKTSNDDSSLLLPSFLHISAIGSDSPGKCELSEELILQAHQCWVDSKLQSRERGEFQSIRPRVAALPIQEIGAPGGILDDSSMGTNQGTKKKSTPGMFSIFDSSGMAIQDVQMAKLISQSL